MAALKASSLSRDSMVRGSVFHSRIARGKKLCLYASVEQYGIE